MVASLGRGLEETIYPSQSPSCLYRILSLAGVTGFPLSAPVPRASPLPSYCGSACFLFQNLLGHGELQAPGWCRQGDLEVDTAVQGLGVRGGTGPAVRPHQLGMEFSSSAVLGPVRDKTQK